MMTSRVVRFHAAGTPLDHAVISQPELLPGEILVRVVGCTICGSDLHTMHGRRQVPVPTILGHEIVGEMVAMHDSAPRADVAGERLAIGDRVVWSIVASCGDCFYCNRELPQKCAHSTKYGHECDRPGHELLGGFADYCRLVPGTAIVKISRDLPLEIACPAACGTATIAAAREAADDVRGRVVIVAGAGLLGLTACAMAATEDAQAVVATDVSPDRLRRALEFGATHVAAPEEASALIHKLTGGHGADAAIECSGANSAVASLPPLLRLGGRLILVGSVFPGNAIPLSPERIVRRNLTIVGVHNYRPEHLVTAVRFLEAHGARFPFRSLVTAWFPLEKLDDAVQKAAMSVRVGVRPMAAIT